MGRWRKATEEYRNGTEIRAIQLSLFAMRSPRASSTASKLEQLERCFRARVQAPLPCLLKPMSRMPLAQASPHLQLWIHLLYSMPMPGGLRSDVRAGLGFGGLRLRKTQAQPIVKARAWLGLGLAQARALPVNNKYLIITS